LVGVCVGLLVLAGCSANGPTATRTAPEVAGVQETRPGPAAGAAGADGAAGAAGAAGADGADPIDADPIVAAVAPAGAVDPSDESCISGRLRATLTVPSTADGRVPRLQALPVSERQKVAAAYLDCEADAGLRSLVAAGLQVGNPAITEESARCQSQALYDGLGRARFAALATAAIRLDDLTDAEVLAYQGKVRTCP
jgi:hypothetical protein